MLGGIDKAGKDIAALNKSAKEAKKQLDAVQEQIVHVDDEIYWLENAPGPLSDALKNIDHFVNEKSDLAGINHFFYQRESTGLGTFDATVDLGHDNVLITPETGRVIGSGRVDLSEVLCALFPEQIKRQLSAMVTAAADGIESGPPMDERDGLKAELIKRRYQLEIEEEKIISTAEELGLNGFYRRADCNPEIVLMMP